MWFRGALLALGLALAMIAPATTTAQAQQVTFEMTNEYGRDIQVSFYSEDRSHSWPGGSEFYSLRRARDERWTLSCRKGEKICYGAWLAGDRSTYWGVGYNRSQRCDRCCVTCEGGVLKRTLN
jgi:hypothetical protein